MTPDGHVVAVDANPRLAQLVERSLVANVATSYEVHKLALSDHEGRARFYIPRSTSGTGGLLKDFSAISSADHVDVQLERFDDVVDWEAFSGSVVLKLDVEGSEVPFLRGAQDALRSLKLALLVEVNPNSMRAAGTSDSALIAMLMELGYREYREMNDPTIRRLDQMDGSRRRNILAFFEAGPKRVGAGG